MARDNRPSSSRLSTAITPAHIKSRQFSHLNSQLAQLQAHLADLDNHIRITAIQAEAMKRLGAQHASMYCYKYIAILTADSWLPLAPLVILMIQRIRSNKTRSRNWYHLIGLVLLWIDSLDKSTRHMMMRLGLGLRVGYM